MRILAIATLVLSASFQPVMAETKIPPDLHKDPKKFCMLIGVLSSVIMERRNMGEPIEDLYEGVAKFEHPQLRKFLVESVSRSLQFPPTVKETDFGELEYQRCMRAMPL